MTAERPTLDHLTRRRALSGIAVVGVGAPLLAACSSDDGGTATDSAASSDASSGAPSADASSDAGDSGASGLTTTSDIEVGGGQIFSDEEVVIVQPTAGDFKGYSAVCTHQGCLVAEITSDGIVCPCHNSVFSLEDGSPTDGPASEPLESVELTVTGDQISLA